MHEYQFAGRFFTCFRIRLRLSKYISIKTKALLQTYIHTFGTLTYYIENVFYISRTNTYFTIPHPFPLSSSLKPYWQFSYSLNNAC